MGWTMSDEIDALGSLATAGLAADALNRPGVRSADINAAATADAGHRCSNCAAPLHGDFCAVCGQKANVHRSFIHVGEEILHGITHFDGKTWKTLPMLVFKPGTLTRDYIQGKRARYVAPVPLFLLVVFTTFLVLSFVSVRESAVPVKINYGDTTRGEAKRDRGLAEIDKELAAARAMGDAAAVKALEANRKFVTTVGNGEANPAGDGEATGSFADRLANDIAENAERGDVKFNFGVPYFDDKANKALKNPKLVFYKLQNKAYKFSFLLVPLSLPWLWLMFAFRRDIRMYDHTVFALYSISFMSLLFIIGSIALTLDFADGVFFGLLTFVVPALHWYAQLKGTYQLTGFGAVWRTVAIFCAAVITLAIYMLITLVLGVID